MWLLHNTVMTFVASGGITSELEIAEFLIRGVYGPEHVELLRLIGTLVDDP